MRVLSGAEELCQVAGEVLGVSDWLCIDQRRIDLFADATDDHQWIHTDPVQARSGPFGSTVAHGFLTLSLLPRFARENYRIDGVRMTINYGLDRVRFPHPVRTGSLLRGITELLTVDPVGAAVQAKFRQTIEVQDVDRPACVAETLTRYYFND